MQSRLHKVCVGACKPPMGVEPIESSSKRAAWRPNSQTATNDPPSKVCGACLELGEVCCKAKAPSLEVRCRLLPLRETPAPSGYNVWPNTHSPFCPTSE